MIVNEILPIWVHYINIAILVIFSFTFIHIVYCFRSTRTCKSHIPLLYFGFMFTIVMLLVNTFSLFNHYIVYISHKTVMVESATWLRFGDRYAMFFAAIVNDIRVQRRIMKWIYHSNLF